MLVVTVTAMAAMTLALVACGENQQATDKAENTAAPAAEQATVQTESQRYYTFVEDVFQKAVSRSPMFQAYLGIKKDTENGTITLKPVQSRTTKLSKKI
ncbi:MAG: hypothetical protein JKY34_08905 [Kordiimonadaceae bacterium]|nr:hypothetical protein [Kordiimonadaceae bacterium]